MAMFGSRLRTFSIASFVSFAAFTSCVPFALAGDPDAPLLLQPRYNADSNSAPARGTRIRTPQPGTGMIKGLTAAGFGQCASLVSSRERQACMMRIAGAEPRQPSASLAEVSGAGALMIQGEDAQ